MFSKLAVVVIASLAMFAAAAPSSSDSSHGINGSCNADKMYCCNETYDSKTDVVKVLTLLGVVGPLGATVLGGHCSPMPVVGGGSCTQQPVCCSGNDFNGLVVVGCSPVNVNV